MDAGHELAGLVHVHEALFAEHMRLWEAMTSAARGQRSFTADDLNGHLETRARAREALRAEQEAARADLCARACAVHDKRLMQSYGLLFDDAMVADVDYLVGNMLNARPTLIVGDKGIAKTQVAKFVMGLYGSEPMVVSVKGDMMSDELIGQVKHDREAGTFRFYEGVVPRAMRSGAPVLLDEVNFGDQAIIARLQDILLKRSGELAFIQEEDAEIEVKPGFTVVATANEASGRYRHREVLDPAIRDRFEILPRSYPDLDANPLFDDAPTLTRLANACCVSEDGEFSPYVDRGMLDMLVRVAAITQHLYAVPAKEAVIKFDEGAVSSVVRESAEPMLADCITPRALCRTVEDSAAGNLPGRTLDARLIGRLVAALDQAGSTLNADLTAQACELAGLEL